MKGLCTLKGKNGPYRKWFISSYVVAYVILFSSLKNIHGQISSPLVHFNVKHCIGEIGKIVKNEILASTSVLSYLGGKWLKYLDWVLTWGSLSWMVIYLVSNSIKLVKICYLSHFWRLPTLGCYRAQANTKKILIYDVDFIKGYKAITYINIFLVFTCALY